MIELDAENWIYLALACERMAVAASDNTGMQRRYQWLKEVAEHNAGDISLIGRQGDEAAEIVRREPPEKRRASNHA